MPAPKKPNDSDRDRGEDSREYEPPRRGRREKPHGRGREREVFLEYLARRWTGSAPPTAAAYARAATQWRSLGAVVTTPTDIAKSQGTGPGKTSEENSL